MKRLALALLLVVFVASPSWARHVSVTGGAVVTGTTSLAVPFPASLLPGDLLYLCVVNKYPTNAPTLPTDAFGGTWIAVTNGQSSGGFGVDGTDLGHVYVTWYYKVVTTGTETGNLTVSIPSGNSSVGRMGARRNSTGLWSVAGANAAVDTSSLSWSAVGNVDPGVTVGDLIVVVSGSYTDAAAFSAHALTQTGVTNFGTVTEGFDQAVTDGDDMRFVFASATVVTGTSSAADLTYTATAGALTGGSTAFIRIREAPSTPVAFGTIGAIGGGTTALSATYPASIAANDLLVLCVFNKYPAAPPTTPANWTAESNGQASGGIDPDGASTGHVLVTLYTKLATGSESGTLGVSIPSGNVSVGAIARYTNTTGAWLTAATNGADNTIDTSWSVTGAADPTVTVGDMVVTCSSTAASSASMTETAEVLTQTNMTFGLSSERLDNGSATGDDVGYKIVDFVAITGTSSDAPVFTATLTGASSAGATAFLRIRQNLAAIPGSNSGFLGAIMQ